MNITGVPLLALITFIVLEGLYLSNLMFDAGMPQYVSRKLGHLIGGVGYLLSVLMFPTPWYPLLLSVGFTLLLGGARLIKPNAFRGVGGTGRLHALAELYFPLGGTLSLLIGWVWLGNPYLALVPILFMSFGDGVTGLIRSRVYKKEVKGNWGSIGMLLTCLLVAFLFTPYWLGAIGAVVATASERYTPLSRGWIDDNYTIVLSSLLVMAVLNAAL